MVALFSEIKFHQFQKFENNHVDVLTFVASMLGEREQQTVFIDYLDVPNILRHCLCVVAAP
ncbi:hypothetical protein FRX31_018981 [Thalictrum thalictroides]|uniref:Uncharacterized protein n=1 Tax=Thalictrum thalictroides TaxID=46969 RepID=A0A7J6W2M0_THATH|nr:hypothetical protein FRX31_018981 [Thalictrum thalictroides]